MEDAAIIGLYWERNEQAIHETNVKYGPYCHTIAYNILENQEDSEECVNDTWLRAWNTMPPQRPNYLRLFLGKITRNLSLDIWKGKQAQKRGGGELSLALDELSECVADTKDVEDALQAKELKETIERFLHTLPKRERELFLQRYFYMCSAKELAARYGMKENHVAVLLSRTRKKLAAQLVKEGWSV
ncbi:MAG: sigma-70 family RNA polymerase sigma factor [Lachnospiraceae bacterium]|nr:sigma-70 family RNA polymerase sigma factor [Lachnospiraceae bacterium]